MAAMRRMTGAVACLAVVLLCLAWGCSRKEPPGAEALADAREAYAKGFYLEAESGYERYLQTAPEGEHRREAWDRLVEISLTIKDDKEKAAALLEAMYLEFGQRPDQAWSILYQLGEVQEARGDKAKALDAWEKCLDLAARDSERAASAQMRMARLYRRQGSYDLVVDVLRNCAKHAGSETSRADCLYELAQAYGFIHSYGQALETLDAILAMDGVDPEKKALATLLKVDVLEHQRRWDEARELLLTIQDTYPNPLVVQSRLKNLEENAALDR